MSADNYDVKKPKAVNTQRPDPLPRSSEGEKIISWIPSKISKEDMALLVIFVVVVTFIYWR